MVREDSCRNKENRHEMSTPNTQICLCSVKTDRVMNRPRSGNPRGPLHAHQEGAFGKAPNPGCLYSDGNRLLIHYLGCLRPQASRAWQEGQRWQIPSHSDRVPYPQTVKVLQDRRCSPTNMEVRECHRQHPCRIEGLKEGYCRREEEVWERRLMRNVNRIELGV